MENGTVRASVGLEKFPLDHYFAAVSGKGAALRLETDMMGPFWIVQEDPGLNDTAAGVHRRTCWPWPRAGKEKKMP